MRTQSRIFTVLLSLFLSFGCTGIVQTTSTTAAIVTSASNFTCSYFAGYDDFSLCQTTTNTTCTSVIETYPNGTIGNCYFPPTGFEACLGTPTWDWVYTTYSDWCDMGVSSGGFEVYRQSRSVVTCSSSLCTCGNTPVITHTCSNDCGAQTPNPLTEMPTPGPCL